MIIKTFIVLTEDFHCHSRGWFSPTSDTESDKGKLLSIPMQDLFSTHSESSISTSVSHDFHLPIASIIRVIDDPVLSVLGKIFTALPFTFFGLDRSFLVGD